MIKKNACRAMFISYFAALSAGAFAQGSVPETAPLTPKDATTPSQNLTQVLSDQQITAVLLAVNKAEVDAGKLAQKTAQRKPVVDFARQMVTEHSQASKEVRALASKHKIKEQGSEVKDKLDTAAKESESRLKGKKSSDFEKTYVDEQVTMHEAVLNSIDSELIPNAKNPDLKALLGKIRGSVSAHLDHAKQLQSTGTAM